MASTGQLERSRRWLFGRATPQAAAVVTAPSCVACAGAPLLAGPLAAVGFTGVGAFLHYALVFFAPLNVAVVALGYRVHRSALPLALGVGGLLILVAHGLTVHRHGQSIEVPDLFAVSGVSMIIGATVLDWLTLRRVQYAAGCATPAEYWRQLAAGEHPGVRRGRRLLRMLPSAPRCVLCNAPFDGIGGALMRIAGKPRAAKNPRFCASCLAKTPPGGAEVEASLLFVDVRGSTSLAEELGDTRYAELINRFYRAATDVLVNSDALVVDFVGDEVVALYLPGFAGTGHARRAADAAFELLRAVGYPGDPWIPVGVGVHTGSAYVGAVGTPGSVIDLRAVGDAVNTTARLTAAATAGTVVLSDQAVRRSGRPADDLERSELTLKGKAEPFVAWRSRTA